MARKARPPAKRTHAATILIDHSLRRRVRFYQAEHGVSFAALVRDALVQYLGAEGAKARSQRAA
jgi:plasmid stability protein